MNKYVRSFAEKNVKLFSGNILEVGSRNVNGSLRDIIPVSVGVDTLPGKGVDYVVDAASLTTKFGKDFDAVISTDMLEHVYHWQEALVGMWSVLKDNGYLFITMAAETKTYHGYPNDYWRFTFDEFMSIFSGNIIVDKLDSKISIGALIKKTASLDITIEPKQICK